MAQATMKQYPAPGTEIQQFKPFRSNPMLRRASRKFHCQERLSGSSEFDQMTFKIENSNPNLVIDNMRLVLPLQMRAFKIDKDDEIDPQSMMRMDQNTWQPSNNIAVGPHAPWSAFSNLEVVINGKVYTKQFPRFSQPILNCFQTYNVKDFADDDSLKPIANSFMGTRATAVVGGVTVRNDDFQPITFSTQEINSGFASRRRLFVEDLSEDGYTWSGEISSLFDAALFSSQARDDTNNRIPHVKSLFVQAKFDTLMDEFERQNPMNEFYYREPPSKDGDPPGFGLPRHARTLPQRLFQFLTPVNAAFPNENRRFKDSKYPSYYELQWTANPYIEINYVEYRTLEPVYKLRFSQHQLEKTLPFTLQYQPDIKDREFSIQRITRDILQVPNLIYIYAKPTRESIGRNFIWGGVNRFCELRNLRVRINNNIDVIADESLPQLYEWFKKNTRNQLQYDVWRKNMIIVLSPDEIGLAGEFLENDATLTSINVTAEVGMSVLQKPEYQRLQYQDELEAVGHGAIHADEKSRFPEEIQAQGTNNVPDDKETGVFVCPRDIKSIGPNDEQVILDFHATKPVFPNKMTIDTDFQSEQVGLAYNLYSLDAFVYEEALGVSNKKYNMFIESVSEDGDVESEEQVYISEIRNTSGYLSFRDGITYWIRVNFEESKLFADAEGHLEIFAVPETHLFNFDGQYARHPSLRWETLLNEQLIKGGNAGVPDVTVINEGHLEDATQRAARDTLWAELDICAAEYNVYAGKADETIEPTYQEQLSAHLPSFVMNKTDGKNNVVDHSRKHVTPGQYAYKFYLKNTGTDPDGRIIDFTKPDGSGALKPMETTAGYRFSYDEVSKYQCWVKLQDSVADDATYQTHNPFKWKYTTAGGTDETASYKYPREHLMFRSKIYRGVTGSLITTEFDPTKNDKLGYPAAFREKTAAQKADESDVAHVQHANPKYELALLLEYNKQNEFMSRDGKPIHNPNLVSKM